MLMNINNLNRNSFQNHPYHLVSLSPWPLLAKSYIHSSVYLNSERNHPASTFNEEELTSNLGLLVENSEPKFVSEFLSETLSTFDESFDNIYDPHKGVLKRGFLVEKFKNLADTSKRDLTAESPLPSLLQSPAVVEFLDKVKKDPVLINVQNPSLILPKLTNLQDKINVALHKTLGHKVYQQLENFEQSKLFLVVINLEPQNIMTYFKEIFFFFKNHEELVNKGALSISMLTTALGLRLLIRAYSDAIEKIILLEKIPMDQRATIIQQKLANLKSFSTKFAPATFIVLGLIGYAFPSKLNVNFSTEHNLIVESGSPSTSAPSSVAKTPSSFTENIISKSLFFSILTKNNNKINWIKLIKWISLILILILILISLGLKFIFNVNLSNNFIFTTILNIYLYIFSHVVLLKYLVIIWLWSWFLLFILEHIKYKYFYSKTFKNIPKYLPNMFKDKIKLMNEQAKSPELRETLLKMSLLTIKYSLGLDILFTCIVIYI